MDCGSCSWDLQEEVREVQTSCGRAIFSTGDTEEEEVCNIYAVLKYLVETNNSIYHDGTLSSCAYMKNSCRSFYSTAGGLFFSIVRWAVEWSILRVRLFVLIIYGIFYFSADFLSAFSSLTELGEKVYFRLKTL